jgi:hypothetical protein
MRGRGADAGTRRDGGCVDAGAGMAAGWEPGGAVSGARAVSIGGTAGEVGGGRSAGA